MQKKAIYGLVLAGLISGTALAGGIEMPPPVQFHPFVGVNYSYMSVDTAPTTAADGTVLTRLPGSYNGINFEGGVKYGHYFGMAWGYQHDFSTSYTSATGTVNAAPDVYYWDMIGYYPVMDNFNLLASIGAQVTDMAARVTATSIVGATTGPLVDNTTVNFRFGVGANYFFTENWGVQAVWNYVPNNNYVRPATNTAASGRDWNSLWTIRVGVYYMFS